MIILDLETTGFDCEEDKIIEFAAIKIDSNFNEIERLEFLVNPEIEVTKEVLKITGIDGNDLKKADIFEKNLDKVKKFLEDDKIIIGHNIQFDIGFLNKWGLLLENDFLDTFVLASLFLPGEKSYALEVLSDKYEIEHLYKHRAMGDVLANLDLFKIIVKKAKFEINGDFISLIEKYGINGRYSLFIKNIFDGKYKIEDFEENQNQNNSQSELALELQKGENNFLSKTVFEFNSLEKLYKNINNFLLSDKKTLVIFDGFLGECLKNQFSKFSNINFINPISNFTSKKVFENYIKINGINEETEGLFLQIVFNIFKGKELSIENINVSYGNYKIWQGLVDKERLLNIGDKNLIDFKTFIEKKGEFEGFTKLFIEPKIDTEDSSSFLSFTSLIEKFSSEDTKNSFSKRLFEMQEMFLDGKHLGQYGLDFQINDEFKSKNAYLYGVLDEFLKDLQDELAGKNEFENNLKNIDNFLSGNSNFYNFIKITDKHFNLNSQKIDLLEGLREVFANSSFGFFGGTINSKFYFLKKIFEIDDFYKTSENEEIKTIFSSDNPPELQVFYPTGMNDLGGKHPDFHNFSLNKISEIIYENKDKKIGIFTPSKTSLKDVYGFLLENYSDFNLIGEGFSGGKNKIIHKIETLKPDEGVVFISQKSMFEKLFTDTDFKFDILIIAKPSFDPPGGIYKIRQDLVGGNFSNYALPKSLIKLKQVSLASGAKKICFLDKRMGTESWAKEFVKVLK